MTSELVKKLRYMGKQYAAGQWGGGASNHYLEEAAGTIEALQSELARVTAELDLRRKSGSASDRLHNLCEGISYDADGSEWSREEWERLDAEMLEQRKRIKALKAARDATVAALRDTVAALNTIAEQAGRDEYMRD